MVRATGLTQHLPALLRLQGDKTKPVPAVALPDEPYLAAAQATLTVIINYPAHMILTLISKNGSRQQATFPLKKKVELVLEKLRFFFIIFIRSNYCFIYG
jgi:hypothetical protein